MNNLTIEKNSYVPLYVQLMEGIKEKIRKGELSPNDKIPSERKLIARYGLNQVTVAKALNELVHEDFLYRVRGKGTFAKGKTAKDPLRRTRNIGLIFSKNFKRTFSDPNLAEVLEGIKRETEKDGYRLLFAVSQKDFEKRKKVRDDSGFFENHVDGMIFVSYFPEKTILFAQEKCPAIRIFCESPKSKIPYVSMENRNAAFKMTEYLISLGHRNIAFIAGSPKKADYSERFGGYREALDKNGISWNKKLTGRGNNEIDGGYKAMKNLLKVSPRPTAVFANNDAMAIGAMKAIKEKGLKIPEDISVAGFDDISWASNSEPPLTTIRFERKKMASLAVRKLTEMIAGKNGNPEKIIVPTTIVVRGSSAKPRAK